MRIRPQGPTQGSASTPILNEIGIRGLVSGSNNRRGINPLIEQVSQSEKLWIEMIKRLVVG